MSLPSAAVFLPSPTVSLGEVSVDLDQRQGVRSGRRFVLTPLEARLLAFLAAHRGTVIDRRRLLRAVWGYAPQVVSRAVDSTVYRLRRKIESNPTAPRWLTSQRAGGYQLELEEGQPLPGREAEVLDRVWRLLQQGDLAGARAVVAARVDADSRVAGGQPSAIRSVARS